MEAKEFTYERLICIALMICACFVFAACGGSGKHEKTVAAMETGEKTRMAWQKARKPLEIFLEGDTGDSPSWPGLAVCMDVRSSLPEEREAFDGAMFVRKDGLYVPSDRNASTSDTAAAIRVCHPFRKGIGANDTIRLAAPFGENLYGVETGRIVRNTIRTSVRLQSAMALLRIVCGSEDLRDRLDGLEIIGDRIYTQGILQPYSGKWSGMAATGSILSETADCLLNNGGKHDFYLIPTASGSDLTVVLRINGKSHAVKAMLPPMPSGSLTHLSLHKDKEGVAINGSWVETERTLANVCPKAVVDSVQVGHYLRADGSIQAEHDSLSVAVVVETDGRHGKAVALSDCDGWFVFSVNNATSGKLFPTIDGKCREGIVNPVSGSHADCKIIYKPGMPYPKDCALGYTDGASLTQGLMEAKGKEKSVTEPPSERRLMTREVGKHPGSYVPSLAELARLYYLLECDKAFRGKVRMEELAGEYLTSSESGESTCYRMDFSNGIVTGLLSKRYAQGKLRLFYLF